MLPENAVKYAYVTVEDGTEVFYRYAGNPSSPPFLLLHGYPSSSFQYRNLMPILAKHFYVVAPDLPAFGFTKSPKDFIYTFDNLSKVIQSFIDKIHLKKPMPVFIFDFGAPTAMRIYQRDPSYFDVIVTSNGNAYEEGLGPFWDKSGLRKFWTTSGAKEDRERIRKALQFESIKSKYTIDNPEPEQTVDPTSYYMDYLMGQKNAEAILDLFYDYRTNVEAYPLWNKQLCDNQPRVLASWGDRDPSFIGSGADAFAKDIKPENLTIHHLDAGHFALESHLQEIVDDIFKFFNIEE